MRRNGFLTVALLTLAIVLAACGGTAPTATPTADDSSLLGEDYTDALSHKNQLLLGTLRLVSAGGAITAEQARALLPLWQAYQTLAESETTAEEETEAVLNQIEATLTQAQLGAIAALKLTNADLTAWYAEQGVALSTPLPGVTPGAGGGSSGLTQEQREATRAAAGTSGTLVGTEGGQGKLRNTLLVSKVIEALESIAR